MHGITGRQTYDDVEDEIDKQQYWLRELIQSMKIVESANGTSHLEYPDSASIIGSDKLQTNHTEYPFYVRQMFRSGRECIQYHRTIQMKIESIENEFIGSSTSGTVNVALKEYPDEAVSKVCIQEENSILSYVVIIGFVGDVYQDYLKEFM